MQLWSSSSSFAIVHVSGLERKGERETGRRPVGIFDGKKFSFQTASSWQFINILAIVWHYGLGSVLRMHLHVRAMLRKFTTIYDLQARGRSFTTVPEMLKAMGGQDLYKLTQVSAEEYLIKELGLSEKLVKELVTGAMLTIYGQNARVNAFAALASLVAMEGDKLWSIVRGNRLLAEKVLLASSATLHERQVCAIRRIRRNGRTLYSVLTNNVTVERAPELPREFDAVIVANPLNTSSIQFEDFPTPVYTNAATTPYQRTIVTLIQGELDPTFFGLDMFDKDFPQYIFTTDSIQECPVNFNSLHLQIPAEISGDKARIYCCSVSEGRETPVWHLSSPQPLTEEQKRLMFKRIVNEKAIDWMAYPKYAPPDEFPPFILDDGVFYINGVEKAASAMEMSAIGAKNVALLAREYLGKN